MVYVTHDQVEAMTLATRIAVLEAGVLQQVAAPLELYRKPANKFVAGFIGSPAMNFVEGTISGGRFRAPGIDFAAALPDGAATLGVRPHDLSIGRDSDPEGVVEVVEPMGWE